MPSDVPPLPRSLIEAPPPDLIPKDLAEALVAIGKLQVTCAQQETKLLQQDASIGQLERIIATADGWKQALLWLGAVTVGASAVLYNFIHSRPGS